MGLDREEIPADNGGLRYNEGKPPISLVPPEAIVALAEVYAAGKAKYGARNWERGMEWTKCYDSLMRHAMAWMRGEDNDPESGLRHMAQAAWNALAILVYAERDVGVDDRPTYKMMIKAPRQEYMKFKPDQIISAEQMKGIGHQAHKIDAEKAYDHYSTQKPVPQELYELKKGLKFKIDITDKAVWQVTEVFDNGNFAASNSELMGSRQLMTMRAIKELVP